MIREMGIIGLLVLSNTKKLGRIRLLDMIN